MFSTVFIRNCQNSESVKMSFNRMDELWHIGTTGWFFKMHYGAMKRHAYMYVSK
jgi:hypothetical protein